MHLPLPLRAVVLLALASPASAAPAPGPAQGWIPVDAAVLDKMRGGFTLPSGLTVGFGIERTVAINGQVVSHIRFEIPDLRQLGPELARQTREALSAVTLVRDGAPAASGAAPARATPTTGAGQARPTATVPAPVAAQVAPAAVAPAPEVIQAAPAATVQAPLVQQAAPAPTPAVDQAALAATAGATVIQNSINDQLIQNRTVINASVNSLAEFKAINFQATLGDALARAAGPR